MNPFREALRRRRVLRTFTFCAALAMLATLFPTAAGAQPGAPTVQVEPARAQAGDTVTISGAGFVGDDCVDIALVSGDDERFLAQTGPDTAAGDFSVEATIPADITPGDYVLRATGSLLVVEFCGGPTENTAETSFQVTDEGLVPRFVPIKPVYDAPLPDGFSPNSVHLKFAQDTDIRLVDGALESASGIDLSEVQAVLDSAGVTDISRLFNARDVDTLAQEKSQLEDLSGQEQGDKNLYFLVSFPEGADRTALLNALNALDLVELAYPIGDNPPDPSHADYRPQQGYRLAAGSGIHADAANAVAGGRGENVQVTNIERGFIAAHEDLPAVTVYDNGAMQTTNVDHGTAVMGVLFGQDNGFGVLGLVPDAAAGFTPSTGGRANAIDVAAANSGAGDVILLEMQTAGANGGCDGSGQVGCAPQEYELASYDATVAAVAAGIIVVGAAGNGQQNLDSAAYNDTFGTRPDSGAIIVGAGAAGFDDSQTSVGNETGPSCRNPERGRLGFSNFGTRVNVQGWGECVMTTGYGRVEGASDSTDSYRASFGGTSSASPIVAAAAGILSSVAQQNGDADGLSSPEARAVLIATGTPQNTAAPANTGNIGPLPNLAAALGLQTDLSLTKTVDPLIVVAGEQVSYQLTVTNNGPALATDVVVTDNLPSDFGLDEFDPACTPSAGDLECDFGTLLVGESASVSVTMDVPADAVFDAGGPATITNSATVTSSVPDSDPSNDTATVDVAVVAEADLAVISTELASTPTAAMIGDNFAVTVRSTVANLGPSSPVDAELAVTTMPSAGMAVAPATDTALVPVLAIGEPQLVEQNFTVSCTAPGVQTVTFDTTIAPASPADTDPDGTNDDGQVAFSVECITPVQINVRPGNSKNQINAKSNGKVHVAVLTTDAGEYGLPGAFDARSIVVDSVQFGDPAAVSEASGGAAQSGPYHVKDSFEPDDRTRDGDDDLRHAFRSRDTGLTSGDTEACIRGQYLVGGVAFTFYGCDAVTVK